MRSLPENRLKPGHQQKFDRVGCPQTRPKHLGRCLVRPKIGGMGGSGCQSRDSRRFQTGRLKIGRWRLTVLGASL
jgi:hypothetical protein